MFQVKFLMTWWNDRRLVFWNWDGMTYIRLSLVFFFLHFSERKGVHRKAEHDPCSGKPSTLMTSPRMFLPNEPFSKRLLEPHLRKYWTHPVVFILFLFFTFAWLKLINLLYMKHLNTVSVYAYKRLTELYVVCLFYLVALRTANKMPKSHSQLKHLIFVNMASGISSLPYLSLRPRFGFSYPHYDPVLALISIPVLFESMI